MKGKGTMRKQAPHHCGHLHGHLKPARKTLVCAFAIILVIYFIYQTYGPLTQWYISQSDVRASSITDLFRTSTSDADRRILTDTLRAFDSAMSSANITYFIIGGTLLGSYRHHGVIPWDDDADVIIPWSQSTEAFKALLDHDPSRFGVYAGLGVSLSSLFLQNGEVNFKFATKSFQWKFYSQSGSKVLLWPYKYPYVDIFFYEENATHLITTSVSFPEVYDKRFVFPLVRRPFNELQLSAPCKVDSFLKALDIDSSTCTSSSFDHKVDIPFLSSAANVPCASLAGRFPFVNRTVIAPRADGSNKMSTHLTKETLYLGRKVLNEFLTPVC